MASVEKFWPLVRLTVDVGVPLVAVITAQSLESLELATGIKVCLTIKGSAIHIF